MVSGNKKWKLRNFLSESEAKELNFLKPLSRHILWSRGIKKSEEALSFLNPDYENHTHDPFLLHDSIKAAERIILAIKNKEKIVIYSDYDADGIPGAVIFFDFLKQAGLTDENIEVYIPNRDEEGFGFHLHTLELFKQKNVGLIVTIDCGIVDFETVKKSKELGIDVIITDHHLPQDGKIPDAFAIVNPKHPECAYPFKDLCGSGVIFKLIQGILKIDRLGIKEGAEKWLLDMVAIATLGDMVPLRGENRVLVHYGMKVLRKSKRIGLKKMLDLAKMNQAFLSEDDIGFMIIPRINTASRMGETYVAFKLFSTEDQKEATSLALVLEEKNSQRKISSALISKEARKKVKEKMNNNPNPKFICIGNPDWKPAFLGPVAGNLSEEYNLPTFVWGRSSGVIKGSCRSQPGLNIVVVMKNMPKGFLKEFGGHPGAGGFSLEEKNIFDLDKNISEAIQKNNQSIIDKDLEKLDVGSDIKKEIVDDLAWEFTADMLLSLDDVTEENWNEIEKISPFGMQNKKPIFMFKKLDVYGAKFFGKGSEHLEISFVNSNGRPIRAIGFFMNSDGHRHKIPNRTESNIKNNILDDLLGKKIDLVASIEKSYFRNRPELRLRIIDIIYI